jgi:hypothetical protein
LLPHGPDVELTALKPKPKSILGALGVASSKTDVTSTISALATQVAVSDESTLRRPSLRKSEAQLFPRPSQPITSDNILKWLSNTTLTSQKAVDAIVQSRRFYGGVHIDSVKPAVLSYLKELDTAIDLLENSPDGEQSKSTEILKYPEDHIINLPSILPSKEMNAVLYIWLLNASSSEVTTIAIMDLSVVRE